MSKDEINAMMEDHLPKWAICRARGVLMLGAQLPTRDGRRNGNAHIVGSKQGCLGTGQIIYSVLTDAGSEMAMTAEEIAECFYPPEWVSDVREVLKKFQRK
jgi:hypothetical protein